MYDLAIIGGGPGGYTAAEKAGKAGLKVILFEKKELGGVCLGEGCIPTKTLLYSAKLLDYARHGDRYGVNVEGASADYAAILKRKEKVIRKLTGGIKVRMREAAVEVVSGEAHVEGRDSEGISIRCGESAYKAARLLVCTGSESVIPPVPGLREGLGSTVITSREALAQTEIPAELVVIGGGVIGMEFASLFNSLGSKVTVIEMMPKLLGPMDDEISTMLKSQYEKKGVTFHLGCKVVAVEDGDVVFETPDAQQCRAHGDRVLVSTGRKAVLEGFGLENLGVELALTPSGRPCGIRVDGQMRTSAPGVYAAGDVTGFSMLAHTASREAEVAVDDILCLPARMRYDAVPGVVYTNPEVAGVGLTEAEAVARGLEVDILKLPLAYSGRFVAENERGEGLCKIIASRPEGRVLGVHIIGNPCSEIIPLACVAIDRGLTVRELREVIFPHPTVSEIIKETLSA